MKSEVLGDPSGLTNYFHDNPIIILAILFGSQTTNQATVNSDYDFAILMDIKSEYEKLGIKETIRNDISAILDIAMEKIDIVDIARAKLSIASTIVSEGKVLKGDGTLELSRFYLRTWALEEDFYWRLNHENRSLSS